jgi:hypothetical protein
MGREAVTRSRAQHHEPSLFASRRVGCWATCECGRWRSGQWSSVIGAMVEFGKHLLEEQR